MLRKLSHFLLLKIQTKIYVQKKLLVEMSEGRIRVVLALKILRLNIFFLTFYSKTTAENQCWHCDNDSRI